MFFEIAANRTLPYSAVCYIRCDWPDGSATRASAVVIGVNDVLTALHAVYDESRGGWAASIVVYPGADTSPVFTSPFGAFSQVGSVEGRAPNWDLDGDGLLLPSESAGDLALIGMSTAIGNVSGWLPVASVPFDFSGEMAGYPARGSGLMDEYVLADASTDYGVYDIASGLGAGASGGPLLYTAGGSTAVAGVLSAGTSNATLSTYAGLFGAGTWDWLTGAMNANDALLGLPPGSAPLVSPNVYMGTAGADTVTGTSQHDVFTGLAGNDVFNGMDGIDLAIYSGTRASHTITIQPGSVTVGDAIPTRDGTDTLFNVERIRFDDVSVAFDIDGNAGQAYRLYQAAFDRQPDLPGLGYQMNELDMGHSLSWVAANFIASPEFQSKYGNAMDDAAFVTLLYEHVLHRAPQQSEVDYHVQKELDVGYSRADVLTFFSESPEDQARLIGAIQDGIAFIPT